MVSGGCLAGDVEEEPLFGADFRFDFDLRNSSSRSRGKQHVGTFY